MPDKQNTSSQKKRVPVFSVKIQRRSAAEYKTGKTFSQEETKRVDSVEDPKTATFEAGQSGKEKKTPLAQAVLF
ncbi:MAG: hypothetical protein PHP25_00925 [Candidatus Moranbacteria bacterium]|nr:hypothetical protein [Candidatus Moranbacteria bacterium]